MHPYRASGRALSQAAALSWRLEQFAKSPSYGLSVFDETRWTHNGMICKTLPTKQPLLCGGGCWLLATDQYTVHLRLCSWFGRSRRMCNFIAIRSGQVSSLDNIKNRTSLKSGRMDLWMITEKTGHRAGADALYRKRRTVHLLRYYLAIMSRNKPTEANVT